LYVFAHCRHVLSGLNGLLKLALSQHGLANAFVLITVSDSLENLTKQEFFRSAGDRQLTEQWNADVGLVREILTLAQKDPQALEDCFSTAFACVAESAHLGLVREYIDSPYQTLEQWLSSKGRLSQSNPAAF